MVTEAKLRGLTASTFSLLCLMQAAGARQTQYISGISVDGITKQLAVDRTPALYTGNFGDCLEGQPLFNITKFDAAVSLNLCWVSLFKMSMETIIGYPSPCLQHVWSMVSQKPVEKEC